MLNLLSESALKTFFNEIYLILKETDTDLVEIWCEISKISSLAKFNDYKLKEFLFNFKFITIRKGNYINYIVINKILFIIESINILRFDVKRLSEIINYNGFESLIKEILSEINYISITNFRFSDKSNYKSKTSQRRYELDVIGIYLKYILLIDAKQWRRRDSYSSLNKAANLQYRRTVALKKNPEIFQYLLQILKNNGLKSKLKLPLLLIPVMVTLEDNSIKISENQIPLVSIYELNSFLLELQDNLEYFKIIKINRINKQKTLF